MSSLSLGVGNTSLRPIVQAFNTSVSVSNITTPALSGVPAGNLLVLTCASADDNVKATNVTIIDTATLTWTKVSETPGAASSAQSEIWTAPFVAGGSTTVTATWAGGTTISSSSVLYSVKNQEAVLGGASNNAQSQALPSVALTTTKFNSLIFCVSSDWNGINPATKVYRDTGVETLVHFVTTVGLAYTAYHYYKIASSIIAYTEGLSAPAGMSAGTSLIEIRKT